MFPRSQTVTMIVTLWKGELSYCPLDRPDFWWLGRKYPHVRRKLSLKLRYVIYLNKVILSSNILEFPSVCFHKWYPFVPVLSPSTYITSGSLKVNSPFVRDIRSHRNVFFIHWELRLESQCNEMDTMFLGKTMNKDGWKCCTETFL